MSKVISIVYNETISEQTMVMSKIVLNQTYFNNVIILHLCDLNIPHSICTFKSV